MADDIKACQAKGKSITISLGGATGGAMFNSDAQAKTFADTVWNTFLGGSGKTRPFGTAVLDGYVYLLPIFFVTSLTVLADL
jgi:chitinase